MDDQRRAAEDICARLRSAGHRALLAGGCVRDLILNHTPKDYDIATDAEPDAVSNLFETSVPIGAAFGVQLVVVPEGKFEVATFRQDGPYLDGRHPAKVTFTDEKHDALRRDFTINALFYDPEKDEILDYVDGRADIEAKVVRAVGDPEARFAEDYLRMLRAVRFAARLDYTIDESTLGAIRELAPNIHKTSAERVRDELVMMLTESHPRRALEQLDETGLLHEVLPEIKAMQGVEQPPAFHPEGDVWVHTLMMLDNLESPSPTLALGALLHDVGKPPTQTFEDRIRFSNHDKVGADMSRTICRRLRMSNEVTDRVEWLVGQHMRLPKLSEMRESKRKRLVREEGFDELLELCRIDCVASHGDTSAVEWAQQYAEEVPEEVIRPKPLLTGQDLIALGYKPGPRFKVILTAVEDAQLEGDITTTKEAKALVQSRWPI
jgi:poly(A) polymerase